MKKIATIKTCYTDKFGIPRQSGIVPTCAVISFEPEFRTPDSVRGIEGFSHLWLLWEFSANKHEATSLTVRPPRLGGNKRMGVFATRSPYRPNGIGLSSVRLLKVEYENNAPLLYVEGADLLDGTPIIDIKPYVAYTDSHPDAVCGFADDVLDYHASVRFENGTDTALSPEETEEIRAILQHDPRPAYINERREYKMSYKDRTVTFVAENDEITVTDVSK